MMRIDEEWRMSCDWRRMDMYIWWRNFGTLSGIVYGANGDKEIFCFGFNFIQRDFQIRNFISSRFVGGNEQPKCN